MKNTFERLIQLKNYDLKTLLKNIDQYHIEGQLTDEDRQDLYAQARREAIAEYDLAGEINALWAAVRELQKSASTPEQTEKWPEFVQPTHAGTAYQIGDRITFKGERYVCILAHCVWSPADYPAGWQKQ